MFRSYPELTLEQELALQEVEQCFLNITRIRTNKNKLEQQAIIEHIDRVLDKYCEPAYSIAQ
jgi:hypothetical protein